MLPPDGSSARIANGCGDPKGGVLADTPDDMFPPFVVVGTIPSAALSGESVVPSILMDALPPGPDVDEADAPSLTLAASSRSDGAAVAAAGEVVKRTWPGPNVSKVVVVACVVDEVTTRACEKGDGLLARTVDGVGRGVVSNATCPPT